MKNTLSVIESTPYLSNILSSAFDNNERKVIYSSKAKQGFEQLNNSSLVCVDLLLDDVDGMSLIEDIRLANPTLPIIGYINKENCSSIDIEAQEVRAMAETSGANAVLFSPINLGELISTINRLQQINDVAMAV